MNKSILSITTTIIVASTLVVFLRNESSVNAVDTEKNLTKRQVDLIHKKPLSSKHRYQINHNAYGKENVEQSKLALKNHH